MAGNIVIMSTIKQLIQLQHQGMGKKPTARTLNISKNTVKTYLENIKASPFSLGKLLTIEAVK